MFISTVLVSPSLSILPVAFTTPGFTLVSRLMSVMIAQMLLIGALITVSFFTYSLVILFIFKSDNYLN